MSRMMSRKSGNPLGLIMHSGLSLNCSRNNRSYFLFPAGFVDENVSDENVFNKTVNGHRELWLCRRHSNFETL